MKRNKKTPLKRRLPLLIERRFVHGCGCKIALSFLVGLLLCLSLAHVTFGFPQQANANDATAATSSVEGTVSVGTGQGQANNLAGLAVKLDGPNTASASQSRLTDDSGHFRFTQLAAGTYTLEVSVEGFKPWS